MATTSLWHFRMFANPGVPDTGSVAGMVDVDNPQFRKLLNIYGIIPNQPE